MKEGLRPDSKAQVEQVMQQMQHKCRTHLEVGPGREPS